MKREMKKNIDIERIAFDEKGLVPAIIQDVKTKEVLMLAYMNKASLEKTLESGLTWFYSRSRQELWNKGATSGNTQRVIEGSYDCDGDTLLFQVEQKGAACHLGTKTCFQEPEVPMESGGEDQLRNRKEHKSPTDLGTLLKGLYALLEDRKESPTEGSYTSYLYREGIDKILKKIGEESAEVIIASKGEERFSDKKETRYEIADLIYHLLVLMVYLGIDLDSIAEELSAR